MKKANLLIAAVLCMAAAAFAGADFNGTWFWTWQTAIRHNGSGRRWRSCRGYYDNHHVSHDMTVNRTTARGASETKYALNGKENTASSQGGELKYTAVWDAAT